MSKTEENYRLKHRIGGFGRRAFPLEFNCVECGKACVTKSHAGRKYCSNECVKAVHLRKQKTVDNERRERRALRELGNGFNKYKQTK